MRKGGKSSPLIVPSALEGFNPGLIFGSLIEDQLVCDGRYDHALADRWNFEFLGPVVIGEDPVVGRIFQRVLESKSRGFRSTIIKDVQHFNLEVST